MAKQRGLKEIIESGLTEQALKDLSFEEGLMLLDDLVREVEGGALPLDNSILAYEQGVKLIARLRELLSGAEEKLKTLQLESEQAGKGLKKSRE